MPFQIVIKADMELDKNVIDRVDQVISTIREM